MGDSCCSPHSMGAVKAAIEAALPGVFVHSIALGSSETTDVLAGYFGNLNAQVAAVCDELLSMDQLQQGYVAVGFSQGGQFMRAVVQRCQHLGPRAHTLVTMGAQHQGVMSVPGCPEPASSGGDGGGNGSTSGSAAGVPEPDSSARGANGGAAGWHGAAGGDAGTSPSLYCRLMQGLIARGAYVSWVQSHVVQAQYVKDPYHLDLYYSRSIFLADINGEVPGRPRPARYAANLASLQRLVLFQFEEDDMVVPKESSHFGFFNGTTLLRLQNTPLYQQDWIGLRSLDEAGHLALLHAPGRHMQFSLQWFVQNVVHPYLAVPAPSGAQAAPSVSAAQQ
ncbi:palmitoyl-thioesterase 1 [Micractinium conductrix]|uniref:Palmitoyl-protein thioesterase 1 n=1 Tax=Micractinium conductrix TaxID=554055 RepID=A0A2P6V8H9_9CHLO|nr:palmitoyl-thioesterase 1 [Micractinium conductrix]|eukprot:PSC70395.1 palmitoyl-thioesterase 1 [Micractinium conductrix]